MIQAIKYNNWFYNEEMFNYIFCKDPSCVVADYIPIGSVEFVLNFLKNNHNIENIKPLNIPEELRIPEFTKRWTQIVTTDTDTVNADDEPIFVKDNTRIKGFTEILSENESYPAGEWLVSKYIHNVESEWRAFVFKDQLVGLQCYSGDFTLFPSVTFILRMIEAYRGNNPCYTLDVGVNDEIGTFVLECHDFFSCGLYGFADYKILPQMFIASWNKLKGGTK